MREQDTPKKKVRLIMGPHHNLTVLVRGNGPWFFPQPIVQFTKGLWSKPICDVYGKDGMYMGELRNDGEYK